MKKKANDDLILGISQDVKEIKKIVTVFSNEKLAATSEMFKLLVDVYCFADDLNNITWSFLKEPTLIKREKITKQIGSFHHFAERMEYLQNFHDKSFVDEAENQKHN